MVLNVVSEPIEDLSVGQTLRFLSLTERLAEEQKHVRQEDQNPNLKSGLENDLLQEFVPKVITDQSNFCLSLMGKRALLSMFLHLSKCEKTCYHIFMLEVQEVVSLWKSSLVLLVDSVALYSQ